jgi:hypothetical protein
MDPNSTDWMTVQCRTHLMEGRRLDDWILVSQELSRRYSDASLLKTTIVLKAIEEIERTHRKATEIAELDIENYDLDRIQYYEKKLNIGFYVPATGSSSDSGTELHASRSAGAEAGTLPGAYALPGVRSFAVGAQRVSASSTPLPIRALSIADVPDLYQTAVSIKPPLNTIDQSATISAEPDQENLVPGTTESSGVRKRRSSARLEK